MVYYVCTLVFSIVAPDPNKGDDTTANPSLSRVRPIISLLVPIGT